MNDIAIANNIEKFDIELVAKKIGVEDYLKLYGDDKDKYIKYSCYYYWRFFC